MNLWIPFVLAGTIALQGPTPAPQPAGSMVSPPERPTAAGAPLVYSHTDDVGPDQSFLLVGEGFAAAKDDAVVAFGASPDAPEGRDLKLKVQFVTGGVLAATIPERAFDGPFLVWAKNAAGFSQPVVLNVPDPWWYATNDTPQRREVRVFGRNLARRPDFARAFVYVARPGQAGRWLDVLASGKFRLDLVLPEDLAPGDYQLWVHAGNGGRWGWGGPMPLTVRPRRQPPAREVAWTGTDLQQAVDQLAAQGGGLLQINPGVFPLSGTLVIPANVTVAGSGHEQTFLQAPDGPPQRFELKDRALPKGDRAAVWLAGDGAALSGVTLCGSPQTNLGIAVCSPKFPEWIADCTIGGVAVRDVEGKHAENCAVRLYHALRPVVAHSDLCARTPIFLSGVKQGGIYANRLVSATRWGGNSDGYIQGRNETVRNCVIEENVFACPPGAQAGGPTGRRMIWLSTGRGSVDQNWIAGNREDRARFGGVAGTDQNVGEMILFEACQRTAYFGPADAADALSVTLPATLPPTPDDRLGGLDRKQLAHDAKGNETPFWPPDADRNDGEPVATEYFVTVLGGRGLGQTRRVAGRKEQTYLLDRPWRVPPIRGSLVLVHTAYWRNHVVANRAVDGMTGIQLWISCIENVLADNEVGQQRRPGVFLYGTCTTLASSMPTLWNRGIGPLYFNHVEGTRCLETSCGALVTTGEDRKLPVEFPRALGNVLRHNSFDRSRTDGVLVTGSRGPDEKNPSPAVLGTIVEFNTVRDARVGYHVAPAAEATLLRRNHAYFWYPVSRDPAPPVGVQIDDAKATAVTEHNAIEGTQGDADAGVVPESRGPRKKP